MRSPRLIHPLNKRLNSALLRNLRQPALLQERIIDLRQLQPLRPSAHMPKDIILMLPELIVQRALLGRALDASGAGLHNVDVLDALVVFVRLDVEGYGGYADRFAEDPADGLKGEDGVRRVGEGFVLCEKSERGAEIKVAG